MADDRTVRHVALLWFQQRQFGIYSRYCNNHPAAVDELRTLLKDKKYQHFFEVSKRHTAP